MRALLISAALIAGCGHPVDNTADVFCTNVGIMFDPAVLLGTARQSLSAGRCQMLNAASNKLSITIVTFQGTATPFRGRPEVRRTLDALDKLALKDVFALHCDDEVVASPAQIDALLPKVDDVSAKLEAVRAACTSR